MDESQFEDRQPNFDDDISLGHQSQEQDPNANIGTISDEDSDKDSMSDGDEALSNLPQLSQSFEMRDKAGQALKKSSRSKGGGKEGKEFTLDAAFFDGFKGPMMAEMSQVLASGFGTVSVATEKLRPEQKAT